MSGLKVKTWLLLGCSLAGTSAALRGNRCGGLTGVAGRRGGADPLVRGPPPRGAGGQWPRGGVQGGGDQRRRLAGKLRGPESEGGAHRPGHGGGRGRRVGMRGPVVPRGRRRRVCRAPATGRRRGLLGRVLLVADAVVVVVVGGEVRVLRGGGHREVLRAEAQARVARDRVLVRVHGGVLVQLQVAHVHLSR